MTSEHQDTGKLNGWEQWGKYVVKELERLNGHYQRIEERVERLHDKQNGIDRRLEKVELLIKVIAAIMTPVAAWAIIEMLQRLI